MLRMHEQIGDTSTPLVCECSAEMAVDAPQPRPMRGFYSPSFFFSPFPVPLDPCFPSTPPVPEHAIEAQSARRRSRPSEKETDKGAAMSASRRAPRGRPQRGGP